MQLTGSHEWPHAFLITSPTVQTTRTSIFIRGQPAWLLDYTILQGGTVVPQRFWSPQNPSDTQVPLHMPIFFVHKDRKNFGLPLIRAAAGDCMGLLDARIAAPVGDCSTMYIRISWPGYDDWPTQIMTKDQTSAHRTIILEKFAKRVASGVCRFLDVSPSDNICAMMISG
ncbi:hypothetical protein B0F90DRAFT_1858802 [Multifurca ochricompacta]|uniref:Uncharacterized protein n=1 Tax=Multifurca ochricompacta TaxID=376703 RepID=A0AAD4QML5_9AGAM|nr:hypothetical protein B0F90DRAFT_1858802 [Multifurca ochricompacta]